MAYPSGHTSNIVLVYGLVVYVLGRYRSVGRTTRRVMWSVVMLLSVTMVVTSLTLTWHWFADLIAGLIIGAVVLQLTAAIDTAVPDTVLSGGPHQLLRSVRRWLRPAPAEVPLQPTVQPPAVPPDAPPVVPQRDAS